MSQAGYAVERMDGTEEFLVAGVGKADGSSYTVRHSWYGVDPDEDQWTCECMASWVGKDRSGMCAHVSAVLIWLAAQDTKGAGR